MGKRFGNTRQPFETIPKASQDPGTKESLDRIQQFLDGMLMSRFEGDHFEISFTVQTGQTQYIYAHNFRFMPKDIWITNIQSSASGTVTISYEEIDETNIVFNLSGTIVGETLTIRFFAGTFVDSV